MTEDERRKRIINDYEDLFKNNYTIKDLTIDIQLKKDVKPIQQKGRPVPIHFQKIVREELEKLIDKGHLEKADKTTENCFVSPAGITIKKDKSVKIALDSRKLNDACIKRKAAMPNMEELISKISAKITKGNGDIWMSKNDLDFAYGQAKLSKEAARHCVFSICETHRHLDNNNNDAEEGPSTSRTLPTMPTKKKYKGIIAYDSSSGESNTADPNSGEDNPDSDRAEEDPEETDLRAEIGREIERLREQTPAPTTQVGCSTGRASNPPQPDVRGTPIHRQTTPDTGNETAEPGEGTTGKIRAEQNSYFEKKSNKIRI